MSIYAVGDVQGCLKQLRLLLQQVQFDPHKDQLWSVGDLINRGPESLATLRFCRSLGDSFRMVLGNHDLHLLAVAEGVRAPNKNDTFNDILAAPDLESHIDWLKQQPLMFESHGYLVAHAGIPPCWGRSKALKRAAEVSAALNDYRALDFLTNMYGCQPTKWSSELSGNERLRVITNYFTRMRFCTASGKLNLKVKTSPDRPPAGYLPWFKHKQRKASKHKIIFGHWAAHEGRPCGENLFPLDTGCVWGGPLRMMDIKTRCYYHQY